jgi:hypothetical protein
MNEKKSSSKGGPLPVNIPSAKVPSGPKQSSGATKHARMNVAPKVESSSNLPKVA